MTRYLKVAPWCAPIPLPEPEYSGPMSAAYREVAPRLRAEALQVMADDAAAQRAASEHRRTYPRAYRGSASGTIPRRSSHYVVGDAWDDTRHAFSDHNDPRVSDPTGVAYPRHAHLLIDDPRDTSSLSARQLQCWTLDRIADDMLIRDEIEQAFSGRRFLAPMVVTDDQGREHHYIVDERPSVAIRAHMDVWSRDHRKMLTRADRVAFRGVARVRNARQGVTFRRTVPTFSRGKSGGLIETTSERVVRIARSSHRYEPRQDRVLTTWADKVRHALILADVHTMADRAAIGSLDTPDVPTGPVTLHATVVRHPDRVVTFYGRERTVTPIVPDTPRMPVGRPLVPLGAAAAQHDAWTMGRQNLARECDRRGVADVAARIRSRIEACWQRDQTVVLAVGSHEVIWQGARVRAIGDDPTVTYGPAEYARRAALAGRAIV